MSETRVMYLARQSRELQIDLFVKRDDEFPSAFGGNKARIGTAILSDADIRGFNAIVTAGGEDSNHLRVMSILASERGWPTRLIVHEEPRAKPSANRRIAELCGSRITHCKRSELLPALQQANIDLKELGYNPIEVFGGGHTQAGAIAYRQAAEHTLDQFADMGINIDYILVACGTGTTAGGIVGGATLRQSKARIHAVSIAHPKQMARKRISETMDWVLGPSLSPRAHDHLVVHEDYLFGGYGLGASCVQATINRLAETEGLLLDPIYTGKAFYGLEHLVQNGQIPRGSSVCLWHTGGVMNLIDSVTSASNSHADSVKGTSS